MGDLDGDGQTEVAVTAYLADPGGRVDAGSVYVFHGGTGAVFQRFDGLGPMRFDGESSGDLLGGEPNCSCEFLCRPYPNQLLALAWKP